MRKEECRTKNEEVNCQNQERVVFWYANIANIFTKASVYVNLLYKYRNCIDKHNLNCYICKAILPRVSIYYIIRSP